MIKREALKTLLQVFSVGCIESQNTYFDGSAHTIEFGLHKNPASKYPLPQQPVSTSSNPTKKRRKKNPLKESFLIINKFANNHRNFSQIKEISYQVFRCLGSCQPVVHKCQLSRFWHQDGPCQNAWNSLHFGALN